MVRKNEGVGEVRVQLVRRASCINLRYIVVIAVPTE